MAQMFGETAKKNARLFEHFVLVGKFNPYHDRLGRFTNAGGATSFTYRPGVSTAHNRAIEREKKRHEEEEKNKPKGVDACKSVEEVQDMLNNDIWFDMSNTNGANLAGVDLEAAKEIYRAYEQVFDKYPVLQGWLAPVQADTLGGNTYAQCQLMSGKVTVNKKWYGDSKKLEAQYESDVKTDFHPKGTDYRSIVTHEIGHAIDGLLSRKGVNGATLYDTYRQKANPISKQMRSSVNKDAKTLIKDTDKNVSRYATKNHFEWFAESFAEYMTSPAPRPVATEFGKQLNKIMEGVDIDEWY